MVKYFDLNNKKINKDLASKGCIGISHPCYQIDYGSCTLTYIYHNKKRMNIDIPGIVYGGLCFTLPLILADLHKDHPQATLLNSSVLTYKHDSKFKKECDELTMKYLYEHQQQHQDLMNILTQIPKEFHILPFHYWGTKTVIIDALSDEAQNIL